MADSGSCVRGSLLQLQESLSAADRCGAAVASGQLLRGLGQECVLSSGPALLGGYSSSSGRPVPGSPFESEWAPGVVLERVRGNL